MLKSEESRKRKKAEDSDNFENSRMNEINKEGSISSTLSSIPVDQSSDTCTGNTYSNNMNEKTLRIVTQMQETLNIFLKKVENTSEELKQLHTDIHGDQGIDARLEQVCTETDDQTAMIAELREQKKILTTEVDLLKAYVIKLEQKVGVNDSRIEDLTARSMRDNVIITGVQESEGEKLSEIVNEIAKSHLKLPQIRFVEFTELVQGLQKMLNFLDQ